jgi:hypothetical protein
MSGMNKNPLNKGVLMENGVGIVTVTPEMVEERANELAAIAGRIPPQASVVDFEHAKRELTGEPDTDVQAAILQSIPESLRWDPVPGSSPEVQAQANFVTLSNEDDGFTYAMDKFVLPIATSVSTP